VVLLDCVRARSFPGTGAPPGTLPMIERIGPESTVFTRASTVAPWTLPSHASLFSGLYPWEHGVLGEGRLQLNDSTPMVAGLLRGAGYATLGLSANGLLAPLFAAPGSFETYRCAEWWEKTLRWISPERVGRSIATRPRGGRSALRILGRAATSRGPGESAAAFLRSHEGSPSLGEAVHAARPDEGALGRRAEWVSWAAIDGANRLARVLRTPLDPRALPIAPWIERTLESWLGRQSPATPLHVFVNLLDAHEKYLSDPTVVPGLMNWLRFLRIPQNARRWLRGEWRPGLEELDTLRRLYESTLVGLDRRVGQLIDVLRRAGRWDNTLLVLTSDHGQAFGEHGELFHERSPFEPLLHVPLWVRWPHGEGGGQIRSDHVGILDIPPTLLEAAGVTVPPGMGGVPLRRGPLPLRAVPLLAMADGYPSLVNLKGDTDPRLVERLRRAYAVAYQGNFKGIVGLHDGGTQVYDLAEDPEESHDLGPKGAGSEAVVAAQGAAEQIRQVARGLVDPSVEERLRSWGYL
jgi:arylsulfatase A-like enzyme